MRRLWRATLLVSLVASAAVAVNITITIPDAVAPRVVDAICSAGNYQDLVDGQPNPESRNQFARRYLKQALRDTVRAYELQSYSKTERATAESNIKAKEAALVGEVDF